MMPQVSLKDTARERLLQHVETLSTANTDLFIVCSNGVVNTHQALLSWASGFLRRMFMSQLILEDGGKRKEEVTLHFPDFDVSVVKAMNNFLLFGELNVLANRSFQNEFEQAWDAFRIDRISFKTVHDDGKLGRKPPATSVNYGRPVRSAARKGVPVIPFHAANQQQRMKKRLKNPFNNVNASQVSLNGPPGPPNLDVQSPIVSNPSKKLPLSFLKKNQSLLFKSPRFSSTPIRPFNSKGMGAIPNNLIKNNEVSISVTNESQDKMKSMEEDLPIIVEEVSGKRNSGEIDIPSNVKDDLPKGISITKQIVSDPVQHKENVETSNKSNTKVVAKSLNKLPAYVKKVASKGPKKLVSSKLKKKDLKKKPFPVDKKAKVLAKNKTTKAAEAAGRRTSSRLSSNVVKSYNEDAIEDDVFEKPRKGSASSVPKDKDDTVPATKKLSIPLKKVANIRPSDSINDNKGSSKTSSKSTSSRKSVEEDVKKDSKKSVSRKTDTIQLPVSSKEITVSITKSSAISSKSNDPDLEVLTCYLCKQSKDKEQRILNFKNIFYVRSHISKCLYNAGKLFKAIPPGKENSDSAGNPIDEFGLKNGIWYNCEVEGCWLAQKKGVSGQVCYKVYAIHMASQHGALEMVMMEDGGKAKELVDKLMDYEERKKKDSNAKLSGSLTVVKTESSGDVTVEETVSNIGVAEVAAMATKTPKKITTPTPRKVFAKKSTPGTSLVKDGPHDCYHCKGIGEGNTDGKGLSFKDVPRLKEHYAKCLYNGSRYSPFVPPGPNNSDSKGNPIDDVGVPYRCEIKGCWLQKKSGDKGKVNYKVLAHHMASQHGILENVLDVDPRPVMRELSKKIKEASSNRNALSGCRFPTCKTVQFKADNKREIKLHYAAVHFNEWFKVNPETGIPDNFTKNGNRAVCNTCTGSSDKPVYIQGEKEAIRGHLVVKHDMLAEILIQAGETVKEARKVIQDLYPERLTEVYMDTLDKNTVPLNEDFMSKITL